MEYSSIELVRSCLMSPLGYFTLDERPQACAFPFDRFKRGPQARATSDTRDVRRSSAEISPKSDRFARLFATFLRIMHESQFLRSWSKRHAATAVWQTSSHMHGQVFQTSRFVAMPLLPLTGMRSCIGSGALLCVVLQDSKTCFFLRIRDRPSHVVLLLVPRQLRANTLDPGQSPRAILPSPWIANVRDSARVCEG